MSSSRPWITSNMAVATLGLDDHGRKTVARAIEHLVQRDTSSVADVRLARVTFETGISAPTVVIEPRRGLRLRRLRPSSLTGAIVVVAADEKLEDDVVTQIRMAGKSGARHYVVALNNSEDVDSLSLIEAQQHVETTLESADLDMEGVGVVTLSATAALGGDIEAERQALKLLRLLALVPIGDDVEGGKNPLSQVMALNWGAATDVAQGLKHELHNGRSIVGRRDGELVQIRPDSSIVRLGD